MEFLNLHSSALDSPEMAGADPAELGTWLMLARYCAGQENGGVIAGCRAWTDRKWQTVVRVAHAMAMRDTELWSWEGDDLHLRHYPADQEAKVIAKRELARTNGIRGGRPRRTGVGYEPETDAKPGLVPALVPTLVPGSVSVSEPTSEPISEPISESVREGKGREGNEREPIERVSASERARAGDRDRDLAGELAGELARRPSTSGSRLNSASISPNGLAAITHAIADSMAGDAELSRQAETIVRSYPRQERFAEALAMVRGHLAAGHDFEVMLSGTKAAADALAKAPSGAANKYAPSALRFFEAKRWMDDPATLIRPPSAGNGGGSGGGHGVGRYSRGELTAEELALQLGGRGRNY
ncbi:hypothetical protein OKA05_28565 [Luteolibacter arcticus]|uniref:DUF1376 domain-containing protein n=1 Tax=Luteolibacter arcticus TaxID=1581411 RepID=A0ABT3GSM8_9BACT|nr:hypothetical protein [Luteolibacter arcticus]MCW1926539.1 hypothetical protein [Luteolibacter arcticus]